MADFEQAIEKAITDGEIPGAVLIATSRDGSFTYNKAFGASSLKESAGQPPLTANTVMWTASATKLLVGICCAQLVERGLITLDEPVYKYIPEMNGYPVLKGFKDDGSPIEEPHKSPLTLRTLMNHTSGLVWAQIHPLTQKWLQYKGKVETGSTVLSRFSAPMVSEPGATWMYSAGFDFAGLLLERITRKTLNVYIKENL